MLLELPVSHTSMLSFFALLICFAVCGLYLTRVRGVNVDFYPLLHIVHLFSCVAYYCTAQYFCCVLDFANFRRRIFAAF